MVRYREKHVSAAAKRPNEPARSGYFASRLVRLIFYLPTLMYFAVSIILLGIAVLLVGYALWEVWTAVHAHAGAVMDKLLDAIGVIVISLALFDVAKYLLEEEVLRKKHPFRPMEEIRRTLAKFMSIIAIAVCLEALVFIFRAGKTDVEALLYPTLLLFSGVAVVLGLGVYLRISHERIPDHLPTRVGK